MLTLFRPLFHKREPQTRTLIRERFSPVAGRRSFAVQSTGTAVRLSVWSGGGIPRERGKEGGGSGVGLTAAGSHGRRLVRVSRSVREGVRGPEGSPRSSVLEQRLRHGGRRRILSSQSPSLSYSPVNAAPRALSGLRVPDCGVSTGGESLV